MCANNGDPTRRRTVHRAATTVTSSINSGHPRSDAGSDHIVRMVPSTTPAPNTSASRLRQPSPPA
jgi:hypothetical protein